MFAPNREGSAASYLLSPPSSFSVAILQGMLQRKGDLLPIHGTPAALL